MVCVRHGPLWSRACKSLAAPTAMRSHRANCLGDEGARTKPLHPASSAHSRTHVSYLACFTTRRPEGQGGEGGAGDTQEMDGVGNGGTGASVWENLREEESPYGRTEEEQKKQKGVTIGGRVELRCRYFTIGHSELSVQNVEKTRRCRGNGAKRKKGLVRRGERWHRGKEHASEPAVLAHLAQPAGAKQHASGAAVVTAVVLDAAAVARAAAAVAVVTAAAAGQASTSWFRRVRRAGMKLRARMRLSACRKRRGSCGKRRRRGADTTGDVEPEQ
eukprot:4320878-Pleurochrysis_carterae.AAC.1